MQKVWLITGASSGLGRQLVELTLARGDRVAAVVRKADALADLQQRYGNALTVEAFDIRDTDRMQQTINSVATAWGKIDVLVNNAGYVLRGAAEEVSDAQIERQFAVNLLAPIQVTRCVLPQMRKQRGGRIVQISSMGGQAAFPTASLYHAAKWGLEGFTDALRHEVAPFGIQLTIVAPGGMRTSFNANAVQAEPIDAYEQTAVGMFRHRSREAGDANYGGDPRKVAQAIIAATDADTAPERLVLGADAYTVVHRALTQRLAALEAQQDIAMSTQLGR
ncbi:SDR family oxidoreductase [Paraburkholderia solisilvae]|uniref:3-phenylpropionate-dihydrodiol/cinnamic acid-dihydrodiol dehydrogenase n=1 Tax=Paraburkholderia solisilvae TaxID=624376 RepID=A0A6J5CWD6_9BURK|nr:SDR family oxidoreductase [Paraburkholderia solisilvae]CAB3745883.1 3-phenylpropionate-dihydrodiol/cinnamic acid-dihydrodiol dehydrogenase [Paraburkholderia solisilvae]